MRDEGRVALVCSADVVEKKKKIKGLPQLIGVGVKLPPPVLSAPTPLTTPSDDASPFSFLFLKVVLLSNSNCVCYFHTTVCVTLLVGADAAAEREKSHHLFFYTESQFPQQAFIPHSDSDSDS